MEIRCRCTGCQAKFKVDAKYAGKKARCPKCQAVVEVPLHAGEESTTTLTPAPAVKPGTTTTAIPVAKKAASAPAPAAPVPALPPPGPQAAIPTTAFPSFSTTPKPASGSGASPTGPQTTRKTNSTLPLVLAGGALVIVAAVTAGGVMLATSGSGSGKAAKGGKPAAAQSKGTLFLDWPQSDRSGGSIVIDGERRAISSTGTLKFPLPPGEHKLRALRRGFEPFDATITLSEGQETHIAPQWKALDVAMPSPGPSADGSSFPIPMTASIEGFDGWHQILDTAKRQAAEAKKDLLIVFGCSDAQLATQELARALEQAQVKNSHVCVVIDMPRTTDGYQLLADSAQNEQLVEEFGVKSVPTLALADEHGRTYFVQRDWEQGFDGLPEKLVQWSQSKGERDALLAATSQGAPEQRIAAAAAAVKWFQDRAVWRFYGDEIGQWMTAAQAVDPENKQALLEVFFEPQWFMSLVQINEEDATQVTRVAGELDPWVARKFQDPDRGVKLHLVAAQLLVSVERFDDGLRHLEHATRYQPKDASMARAVEAAKVAIQNKDVVGNGTGFLVSADGYVLTNKHVADAPGHLEIKLPGTKETVPAEVVAKSEDRDIALVKFTPPSTASLPTLAIAAESAGRGKAVAAFGYPLARELGSGVKLTDGLITGLPDESNDAMFVLSVKINPGNSGGPLCDARGNVVGMITAKTRADFFGAEDSYGLAIPAADLTAFLKAHLPATAQLASPASDAAALSWDQVDDKVSRGVLMIVIKR